MQLELPRNAALILIDVQQAFDALAFGIRNNPDADQHMVELLRVWRASHRPVVIVRHDSVSPGSLLRPGEPGNALKPFALPEAGDWLISKNVNSAFIGTDLEERLHRIGVDTVVMAGYTSQHCVSTTVRMAGNLGFRTVVAQDACVAFALKQADGQVIDADLVHRVSMASLHEEFAIVTNSKTVIAAVLSQKGAI